MHTITLRRIHSQSRNRLQEFPRTTFTGARRVEQAAPPRAQPRAKVPPLLRPSQSDPFRKPPQFRGDYRQRPSRRRARVARRRPAVAFEDDAFVVLEDDAFVVLEDDAVVAEEGDSPAPSPEAAPGPAPSPSGPAPAPPPGPPTTTTVNVYNYCDVCAYPTGQYYWTDYVSPIMFVPPVDYGEGAEAAECVEVDSPAKSGLYGSARCWVDNNKTLKVENNCREEFPRALCIATRAGFAGMCASDETFRKLSDEDCGKSKSCVEETLFLDSTMRIRNANVGGCTNRLRNFDGLDLKDFSSLLCCPS